MTARNIPDLQIPFSKPKHVGYCLGCYRDDYTIYTLPLDASTGALLEVLTRSNVINGEPLTKPEFAAIFPMLIGAAELCWHDDLEFQIVGSNLPWDWLDR